MIRVICKNNGGFRRAGMYHPEGTRDYQDGTFTGPQLKLLQAEPLLVVRDIPDKPADDGGKQKADEVNPEAMTVLQLAADLLNFYEAKELKGKKKEELVNVWIGTHDGLQALAGK